MRFLFVTLTVACILAFACAGTSAEQPETPAGTEIVSPVDGAMDMLGNQYEWILDMNNPYPDNPLSEKKVQLHPRRNPVSLAGVHAEAD